MLEKQLIFFSKFNLPNKKYLNIGEEKGKRN